MSLMEFRRTKVITTLAALIVLCAVAPVRGAGDSSGPIPPIPTPGMVTMVDIGADKCIPCKMMAPIIEELKKDFDGRASIVFIDVWKNPDQGRQYKVRAIPTQIFYDKNGKEVSRHEGFLDKKSIVSAFKQLGVP